MQGIVHLGVHEPRNVGGLGQTTQVAQQADQDLLPVVLLAEEVAVQPAAQGLMETQCERGRDDEPHVGGAVAQELGDRPVAVSQRGEHQGGTRQCDHDLQRTSGEEVLHGPPNHDGDVEYPVPDHRVGDPDRDEHRAHVGREVHREPHPRRDRRRVGRGRADHRQHAPEEQR